jgi:hypothetical protein
VPPNKVLQQTGPSAFQSTPVCVGTYGVNILICLVNGLVVAREWPLIVVFSITIIQSLWLFHRLLTRTS